MKRRRPTQGFVTGSLDSLVDIVTNSLGMLVLVSVLSMLGGGHIQIDLGTPIVKPVPDGLERFDFQCRGNRVMPIDFSCMEPDRGTIRNSDLSLSQRRQMIEAFNQRQVSDGFHRFELKEWEWDATRHRLITSTNVWPLDHPVGDTMADLKTASCEFSRRLAQLDPNKYYLQFYVQPDSFEVFRAARQLTRDAGFKIAWRPHTSDSFTFSPGGGSTSRADGYDG